MSFDGPLCSLIASQVKLDLTCCKPVDVFIGPGMDTCRPQEYRICGVRIIGASRVHPKK